MHYAWVSHLGTRDINITHQGQFLTHGWQIRTSSVVLKKLRFISDLLCIISLLFITIAKVFKCLQSVWIVSVQRSSEYCRLFLTTFGSLRNIFGNLRKWLGSLRKSRLWRDKNLTRLTQKKVGRYIIVVYYLCVNMHDMGEIFFVHCSRRWVVINKNNLITV